MTSTQRMTPSRSNVTAEGDLTKAGVVMADQIQTLSRRRLDRRLGAVSSSTMGQVEDRLKLVLGLS
jgi:mRNA-degrading endonuclease toxin of MazEF toxin-antitoxin module